MEKPQQQTRSTFQLQGYIKNQNDGWGLSQSTGWGGRWQLTGTENVLQLLWGRGKIRENEEKDDPQTYLKARFSIMCLNEMSACKGRADKYGRVMVL